MQVFGVGDHVYEDDFDVWQKPFDMTTKEVVPRTTQIGWESTENNAGFRIRFFGEWENPSPQYCIMEWERQEVGLDFILDYKDEIFNIGFDLIKRRNAPSFPASCGEGGDLLVQCNQGAVPITSIGFILAFRVTCKGSEDDWEMISKLEGLVDLGKVPDICTTKS
jgi:hypothetical protein